MIDRPFENCYWVIPDKFLAGEYPRGLDEQASKRKIDSLIRIGVSTFIDLTEERDDLKPYTHFFEAHASCEMRHLRFPLPDLSVPDSKEKASRILDAIYTNSGRGFLRA